MYLALEDQHHRATKRKGGASEMGRSKANGVVVALALVVTTSAAASAATSPAAPRPSESPVAGAATSVSIGFSDTGATFRKPKGYFQTLAVNLSAQVAHLMPAKPRKARASKADPDAALNDQIDELAKKQGISRQRAKEITMRQFRFSELVDKAAKHADYYCFAEWNATTESGRISMTTSTPTEIYTALVNQGKGLATVDRNAPRNVATSAKDVSDLGAAIGPFLPKIASMTVAPNADFSVITVSSNAAIPQEAIDAWRTGQPWRSHIRVVINVDPGMRVTLD